MTNTKKSLLLGVMALLLGNTSLHADPLDGRGASIGVDYTISFNGSPRSKPEAPTFGFNVSLERGQGASAYPFQPALRMRSQFDKLVDIRFDAANMSPRNMYVGGINVLVPVQRMGVDGTETTATTQLSWPLVAAGFASFYVWAEDRMKIQKKTCTPPPAIDFNDGSSGLGVNTSCCAGFSGGSDGLNTACVTLQ